MNDNRENKKTNGINNSSENSKEDKKESIVNNTDKESSKKNKKELKNVGKEEKQYDFLINNVNENRLKKHKNNRISTTKYNILTFLPKALLFQFFRLANIYFLIIAIIQCIPLISPLTPSTAIAPIAFVLCVSLIREGVEDYARYRYDTLSNDENVCVHREGKWTDTTSQKLEVGEIIIIKDESQFPADLILLDSSLDEGICYIETATLDGEKTLKFKKSHNRISNKFKLEQEKKKFIENFEMTGTCLCDYPSDILYKLDGNIKVKFNNLTNKNLNFQNKITNTQNTLPKNSETERLNSKNIDIYTSNNSNNSNNSNFNIDNESLALDAKQLLLKGAVLKNTEWAIGLVVYTGHNTKLMLNSKRGRVKYSNVERLMSKFLIFILILQSLFCIVCGILYAFYYKKNLEDNLFLNVFVDNIIVSSILNYFTYLLLLNTMIPISLIITLEITKIVQGYFISLDVKLFSKVRQKFCKAGSVSLNEELGQIDYIFSDKTGTLTCNKMKFKYCVIGDVCYEFIRKEEISKDITKMTKKELLDKENEDNFRIKNNIKDFTNDHLITLKNQISNNSNSIHQSKYQNFYVKSSSDPLYIQKQKSLLLDTNLKIHEEFFKALALNNECVVNNKKGKIEYSGLSPDDIELVSASSLIGCELMKSESTGEKKLKLYKEEQHFEILNVIEFTSDRKKSSIIVRDGELIKLYIKGADSEMLRILNKDTYPNFKEEAVNFVEIFSKMGYRTLILGMKILGEEEYKILNDKYNEVNLSASSEKLKELDKVYAEFEKDIYCLGATIVEDKLQDDVPETIRDLRLAGIKIWMLTGDKIDTAENIAKSCNLISEELELFKITNQPGFTFIDFTNKFEKFLKMKKVDFEKYEKKIENLPEFSILIDLKETKIDLNDIEKKRKFIKISKYAKSVICSRCSPGQKSEVVKMIKQSDSKLITLSIGDGGNDVPMITEAHIGIGVYGEEGVMAIQASDFAIGEFKFLRRLLLYHGRINYMRISEMILYFFFKNFVFTITHFYFGFYNNFSGQTIIDDWFISLYNMIFTAFPLGVRAVVDHDLHPMDGKVSLLFQPFLYEEIKRYPIFNIKSFSLEIIRGIVHGGINFFLLCNILLNTPVDSQGNIADMWYFSVNCYTNIIFIVSMNLIIKSKYITIFNFLIMFILSWVLYFVFVIWVHFSILFKSNSTMQVAFTSSSLYLTWILITFITSGIDLLLYAVRLNFSKTISNTLMKIRKERTGFETYQNLPEFLNKYVQKLMNLNNDEKNEISLKKTSNDEKNEISLKKTSSINLKADRIEIEMAESKNNKEAIRNLEEIKENISNMKNKNPDDDEPIFNSQEDLSKKKI